ncbi:uncharacterized protein LOC134796541 [Cydia splendana]|uniref:uncharacterized protein LOC134796541 n=1 Tax=Cydia splendana TaxID=1100963 RepID=UPI0028F461C9
MLVLIVFMGALAAVRADCDACFEGVCHTKKTLLEGFRVTDQLAIDRTNNILYAQLDYRTTAIFLDEAKMRTVHDEKMTGLAVDQKNQVLYSSLNGVIYRHRYQGDGYTKETAFPLDRPTTPARLRYEDVLYMINKDGSSAHFSESSNSFAGYDNLESFAVTDMVNVQNISNWFFVADDKLYRYIYSEYGQMSWHLISDKKHVLSIGRNGDVYFGDASERIIYKLDRRTMGLIKYGDYVEGSVKDFVFDRDENIVFLDADGSVARWLPSGGPCFEPPRFDSDRVNSDLKDFLQRYKYNYRTSPRNIIIVDVEGNTNIHSNELHEISDQSSDSDKWYKMDEEEEGDTVVSPSDNVSFYDNWSYTIGPE